MLIQLELNPYASIHRILQLHLKFTSGFVNALAIAQIPGQRRASVPMGVTKCCKLGVKRKGTLSLEANIGVALLTPGKTSDMYIWPVVRETWKRAGCRLVMHTTYVMKLTEASCRVKAFRILQSSCGPDIVLDIY